MSFLNYYIEERKNIKRNCTFSSTMEFDKQQFFTIITRKSCLCVGLYFTVSTFCVGMQPRFVTGVLWLKPIPQGV